MVLVLIQNFAQLNQVYGNLISEKFNADYFVMEIPAALDYNPIRERLMELEENNIITYAEPNLSKNHWY